ncbi:MAG: caspase family protein [Betaproteobacteria bacterium]|nr:caspase family protein [Betaproteobacteria bacterium]
MRHRTALFHHAFRILSRAGLLAVLATTPALPQGKAQELRVALVVGNAAYPTAALRNPVNDAKAIGEKLRALGFDVQVRTNVTQREFTRAVSQFGQSLKPGALALFYYAGHGMQVRGRNFLIPIDAEIESEASVRSEAVDLDLLLEQLGPARLSMVILDACRNNPFENRFRSGRGTGLAQIDAPKGSFLAYATAPGKVASDGEGSHGLYTAELLKAMDLPGIKVEEAFKVVRVNVIKATASEQIPWESSSLTGDYYFRPVDRTADAAKTARDVTAKQAELQAKLDTERRQRETDAASLKAEMEKLREEVRRLSAASPPAAEKPASPAAAPEPRKGAGKLAAIPADPLASKASPNVAAKPPAAAKGSPGAGATSSPATPAKGGLLANAVRSEWQRRIEFLESQRGTLTFPKSVALLLGPFTDGQLLELVEKERQMKALPYHSAFAIGTTAGGQLAARRAFNERTVDIAQETAVQRCRSIAKGACSAIMANGEFREDAFLAWAKGVQGAHLIRLRTGFLGLRPAPS